MRKSQLSVFMIIGILLLVLSVFLIMIITMPNLSSHKTGKEALDFYLEGCIQQAADRGLFLLGLNSGNIDSPTRHLLFNGNLMPHEIDSSKEQLEMFIEQSTAKCIADYPGKGIFNLTVIDPKASVDFGLYSTFISVSNIYKFQKAGSMVHSSDLVVEIKARYRPPHEDIDKIVTRFESDTYIMDSPELKTSGYETHVMG